MALPGKNKLAELKKQAQLTMAVRILRYLFYFYAFLSFAFWFLNCFEADWLYMFNNLFVGPYKIVATFYNAENSPVDFSLAIIGLFSLLIGVIIDQFCAFNLKRLDILKIREEKRNREKQKKMIERRAGRQIVAPQEQPSTAQALEPMQASKLLFLITPHINKIKNSPNELELTFQEVELWKQRVNKKLIENVIYSKPLQKGYYRKNLFLMYQDFNYVDEFVYYIKPTLDSIVLEFRKYKISVSFSYVMSALPIIQNLEKELDCMDTILSLSFVNECIVTNRFKINYDNRAICKYAIESKGEYNLSKNLSITNRQYLFALVNKKVKEKPNGNENNQNGA